MSTWIVWLLKSIEPDLGLCSGLSSSCWTHLCAARVGSQSAWVPRFFFLICFFCYLGWIWTTPASMYAAVIFLMRSSSRDDWTDHSWWSSPECHNTFSCIRLLRPYLSAVKIFTATVRTGMHCSEVRSGFFLLRHLCDSPRLDPGRWWLYPCHGHGALWAFSGLFCLWGPFRLWNSLLFLFFFFLLPFLYYLYWGGWTPSRSQFRACGWTNRSARLLLLPPRLNELLAIHLDLLCLWSPCLNSQSASDSPGSRATMKTQYRAAGALFYLSQKQHRAHVHPLDLYTAHEGYIWCIHVFMYVNWIEYIYIYIYIIYLFVYLYLYIDR